MEEDTEGDAEEYTEGDTEDVMGEGRGGDTVGDKTGRTDVAVWVKETGRGGRDGAEAPPAYVVVGREHSAERNRREAGRKRRDGGDGMGGGGGWDGGDGTEGTGRGRDGVAGREEALRGDGTAGLGWRRRRGETTI